MTYYKCGSIYTTQNSNVVVDTASGAVANFNTPLAMPLKSLKVYVNAKQDLHGYDHPWPAGGSAQIWDEETEFGSFDTETGEKTPNNNLLRSVTPIPVSPNTTYLRRMNESLGCRIFQYDSNMDFISQDVSSERLLTFTTTNNCAFINIAFQKAATDVGINYPATDTAYHPYSNICPIIGHTEAKIVHAGKNLLDTRQETIPQYESGPRTYAGVTYSPNNDGSITINGTSTGSSVLFFNPVTLNPITNYPFPTWKYTNNRYTLSVTDEWGLVTGDAYIQATVKKIKDDSIVSRSRLTASVLTRSFTVREDEYIADAFIRLSSGASAQNVNIKIQLELGSEVTDYEPYVGNEYIINLGDTYYGGHFIQDKDGKRKFEVTHGYASYDLSQIPPNQTADGWDSWLIYRAERAESNPSSPIGKLCNCCPEYSYAGSQINRPHYYVSAGAFVMYLPENIYRNGFLEYTYPFETPYTIDLPDGTPFKSLPGVNNIFADTGDTSLQFRKIG